MNFIQDRSEQKGLFRKSIWRSLLTAIILMIVSQGLFAQAETESNDTPAATGVQRIYDISGFSGNVASGDVDYWQISKNAGDQSVYTLRLDTYHGASNRAPIWLEKRSGGYDGTLISDVQIHFIGAGTQYYNLNIDYSGGDYYYLLRVEHANFYDSYNYAVLDFNPATCTAPFFETGVAITSVGENSVTINGLTYNLTMSSFNQRYIVSISDANSFTNHSTGFTDITENTVYSGSGDQVVYTSTDGTLNNPNIVVTGLNADTEYFVRATVATECNGYYYHSTGATVSSLTCGTTPSAITETSITPESESQVRINSFTGGATNNSNSSLGYVVKFNTTNSFTAPTNGASLPTANTIYSSGEQVVYAGASAAPNTAITGLSSLTTYYVQVYTYNFCDGTYYFESTGLNTAVQTCGPPANGYNNYLATSGGSVGVTTLAPVYARNNTLVPSGLIIYINDVNSFTDPDATYSTLPTANTVFEGNGQQTVLVGGPSSGFANTSNLIPNTTYYFRSYPYYTCGGTSYVNQADFEEITLTTCNFSDNVATNPVFGAITSSSMELNSFTPLSPEAPATAPDGYVIRMNTTNSFTSFLNGTAVPTGNPAYAGSGEQVIYAGNSSSPNITITGLSANTTYYFNIVAHYPSCHLNGIMWQQEGYLFSKSNDLSLVDPSITFNDISKMISDPDFTLAATSNSAGAINYQIVDQTGTGTSLSGANNSTVTLGTQGTVTIEATQEPAGAYAGGTATATLTITAPDAAISGDPFLLINASVDLNTVITSNSPGAFTYSILGSDLGASIVGSTLNAAGTTGNIVIKATQAASSQYAETDYYVLALIWDGVSFKFDRAFNLFDATVQAGETLTIIQANDFNNTDVTYSIVTPDTTGSSVSNITDVFTAGSPGSVTLRASTPDNSFYNASTKDVTITIEGQSQTITFDPLANVTLGDAAFNLTATASSGLGVSFSSSNTAVATVSGNTVTIVGEGTTNITASQPGGGVYDPAPDVIQSLTVDPISLIDQTVSASETSAICEVATTVSVGSTQLNVNYYLRDNLDNSVIEGPIVGTGSGISFTEETLNASKTYEVFAELGSSSLVMTDMPAVIISTIQDQTVALTQPNATSADISLTSSQVGVDYYLRNNADNTVLQGPLAGNGSTLAFATETIASPTTYNVLGAASASGDGVRNYLSFDGVDDYATIPTLAGGTMFQTTVETWVYIPSSDDTDVNASIITHEEFDGGFGIGIPLYINISGGLIFAGNSDPEEGVTNTAGVAYPKDEWFHVAASFDGNSLLFYLNGTQVGNGFSFGFGTSYGGNWRIGRNHEATSHATKLIGGAVSNTRIWNVIRSATDIANNMNTTYTTPQTNLVLNFTYTETSGTSIADLSGSNHTGTLVNAPGDNTNWIEELILNGPCLLQMTDTPTAYDKPQITASDVTFNSPVSLVYDGSPKTYTVNVATLTPPLPLADIDLTYEGRNGTTYASSSMAPTDAGDYTVTATVNPSNADYAGSVSEDYSITPFTTTISLNLPGTNPEYSGIPQGISPTANDVSSSPTLAILIEYKIQGSMDPFSATAPTDAGTYDVRANLASSEINYSATEVTGTYTIDQGSQTITFNPIPEVACGQTTIDLSLYATSSTGATLTFVSDDLAVATISGNIATMIGAGSATITASQAGDVNNAPAIDQQQVLTISAIQENFSVDNPADVLVCDGGPYILPALTSGDYFSESGGTGISYNAGEAISSTTTLYVYGTGVNPLCTDENSFAITIENLPVDNLADVVTIGSYTLPSLTNGNYFTATGGTGSALNAGDVISSTQTIYIFNENLVSGCTRESSFDVTINPAPALHFEQVVDFVSYDYLAVADNNNLDFTTSFTFETWVNFDQLSVLNAGFGWRCLMAKSRYTDSYALMTYAGDKRLRFYHAGFGAGFTDYIWTSLTAGSWHHVAVKVDGANNKASILIDGVEVASSVDGGSGTLVPNTEPLLIGAGDNRSSDPYPFDGAMDEIRFWNIARTDTEISNNKDVELQGTESGLVLYYNFSEGTIDGNNTGLTQVPDQSSGGNNATFNTFALTGSVSNYVDGSGNGVVEGLPQTITFNPLSYATFGDTNFNLTATASSGLGVTYSSSNTAVATVSGSTVTIVGAGTTTITASQSGDATYLPASNVDQILTVDPFATTIALNLPGTNPGYSGVGQGVTPTANDESGNPTLSVVTEYSVQGMGSFSTTLPVNAGVYDVRANLGASETNYSALEATGTFTIDQVPLTITADNKTITYGDDQNAGHTVSYSGFVNSETNAVLGGSLAFGNITDINVGSYNGAIVPSGLTTSNYNISFLSGDLTIDPLAIAVTADAVGKTYGDSDPTLTYQVTTGTLQYSDTFSGSLTRVLGENVGIYAINQGTLDAGSNYTLTYVSDDLTISARVIEVTADAQSKTYGDADPSLTYQITSGALQFSDAFAGAVTRVAGENIGTYAINQGTLDAGSNYTLTYVSDDLTIGTRTIEVTADALGKTYGDAEPALTYQITNGTLQFSDAFSGAIARVVGENIGTYAINQGTLDAGSNYTLTFVSADLTISARPLFVRADSEVKVYGDVDPIFTPIIASGTLVGGDTFTGSLIRDTGEDVAAYTIRQGTLTAGSNYSITFLTTGSLSITQRAIELTADAQSKTYGDADPALTYQITSGALQFSDAISGTLARATGENVGTYAINVGSLTAGGNYLVSFISDDLNISVRAITLTADAQSKTYGDVDPALTYQITSGALQFSDAFSGALERVAGEDAGTYAINVGTLSLSANYNLSYVSDDLTIGARSITVIADPLSKTYGDSDPTLTYAVTGSLQFSDAFSGAISRAVGENVGTYVVNQGSLSLSSNYSLTYIGDDFTVNQRAITITADDQTKTVGQADPTLTYLITVGTLQFSDAVSGSLSRGAGETVGAYSINQGSLSVGANYSLTFVPGTLTITDKIIQTITFGPLSSVTYGDAAFTLSATGGASGNPVTFVSSNTAVATVSGNTVTIVGAGSTTITASQLGDATYEDAAGVNQSLTVVQRPLEISANANGKTYGDGDPALTYQLTSGNLVGGDGFTGALTREAGEVVGTYQINQGSLAVDANYTINYNPADFIVDASPIEVTVDAKNKTYGDADPGLTYQITSGSLQFSDSFSGSLTREAGEAAGTYAIQQNDLSLSSNYDLTFIGADLTVTQRDLEITADAANKTYGESDPELTYQLTSGTLQFGDVISGNLSRNAGEDAGTYSINQGSVTVNINYVISYVSNDLTIDPLAIEVTIDSQEKTYGDTDPTLTYQITAGNLIDSDTYAGSLERTQGEDAGIYSIGQGTLTAGSNYSETFITADLTINKTDLQISAQNATSEYGSDPTVNADLVYTGFVNGDDESVLDEIPNISTAATTTSSVGSYDATLSGGFDNNYNYILEDGTLEIVAKRLTITANNRSITYGDDANSGNSVTYDGFVNGDSEIDLAGSLVFASVNITDAGTYNSVISASGLSATNYDITYVDGDLTIDPRTIEISADALSKTYGDTDPSLTYQITNGSLVSGDAFTGELSRNNGEDVGAYQINQASLTAGSNYDETFVSADLTISKADLTISTQNASSEYGSDPTTNTELIYSGFVNGDDVSVLDELPVASTTATAESVVGSYAATLSGGSDNNYHYLLENGTLEIIAKDLTVTAANHTITYGQNANNGNSVSYDGFVNGDSEADLSGTLAFAAISETAAGVYGGVIIPSGLSSTNYDISFVSGDLTIDPKAIEITAIAESKIYGDSDPTLSYQITNGSLESGDSMTGSLSRTVGEDAGIYAITIGTLTAGSNYSEILIEADFTINKAELAISAQNASSVYGSDPVLSTELVFSGFINGDDEAVLDELPVVSTAANSMSPVGNYEATLQGGTDNNYNYILENGIMEITKASLIVTADEQQINQGDDIPALSFTYSGFVNAEDESVIDIEPTITTTASADSPAGEYVITLSGGSDNNYEMTYQEGTLTIIAVTATEQELLDQVNMYPVPFDQSFSISIPEAAQNQCLLKILSLDGRVLVDRKIGFVTNYQVTELQDEPEGVYVVQLKLGQEIRTVRVIKK